MKLGLPRWLKHDAARKAFALLCAVLIWGVVRRQTEDIEVYHGLPVRVKPAPGVMVTGRTPLVDVTVRGPKSRLRRLQISDLSIACNIDTVPVGIYFYEVHLSPDNVHAPPGVRVVDVSPSTVNVAVDRIIERISVPVHVRYDGTPREGYKLVKTTVIPDTVALRGPSRIVEAIDDVLTEPVPLGDAVEGFQKDAVKLLVEEGIQAHPETVTVKVVIDRFAEERALDHLRLFLLLPARYPLRPTTPLPAVSVTLRGPKIALDALDASSIRPFVDLSEITGPGKYRRPVQVWLAGAAQVQAEYIHPSMVDVELAPKATAPERAQQTAPPAQVPRRGRP